MTTMPPSMMPNSASCCHPPRSPGPVGSRPQPGIGFELTQEVRSRSRSMKSLTVSDVTVSDVTEPGIVVSGIVVSGIVVSGIVVSGGVAAAEENPPTIASEAKTTRRVRRIDDTSTSFHEGEPIH